MRLNISRRTSRALFPLLLFTFMGFAPAASAETLCLLKAPDARDVAPRAKNVRLPSYTAVVRSEDAAGYVTKGFSVTSCPSVEKLAQYRENICGAVQYGNSYLRDLLEQKLGEKPAKICADARAAVGLPWKLPSQPAPLQQPQQPLRTDTASPKN